MSNLVDANGVSHEGKGITKKGCQITGTGMNFFNANDQYTYPPSSNLAF